MVMAFTATLALLSGAMVVCPDRGRLVHQGSRPWVDLEALYKQGKTYVEFRDTAKKRTRAWKEHYATAHVPDALRTRVRSVPGQWRLLVVAEDWCGDSANTIPYVARLVDVADNLDMRIVDSEAGRAIMEAHRTPDGRAATPTVILLTADFREAGCWVERPAKLQAWVLENERKLEEGELLARKYAWYDADKGQETLAEIVRMIESAGANAGAGRSTASTPFSCDRAGHLGARR